MIRAQYSVRHAAEMLDVSVDTVESLISDGHLTTYLPLGMKRGQRISHAELERYIAASATPELRAVS